MPVFQRQLEAYVSYSHKDEKLVKQFLPYLSPLEREGLLAVWSDLNLLPGQPWDEEIRSHIDRADVFLLMVSPNFLASDWCQKDMRRALERQQEDGVYVVPVIISPCDWHHTPLGLLQALPSRAKPISEWKRRANALAAIVPGIRLTLQTSAPRPPRPPVVINGGEKPMPEKLLEGKTLIIHGHAEKDRYELRNFLQNTLGLPLPIVMADAVKPGKTLPQKFEQLAGEVEFAVALLTPDDKGKAVTAQTYQLRARQNVLVEVGWFWGRLGLDRVLLLVKDKIEIPSDLDGLEYYTFKQSPLECSEKVRGFYKEHGVALR